MKKLTIGFSPCPNDTYIFHALVTGLVSSPHFTFDPILEDVETLNRLAGEGKIDILKLSAGTYPNFSSKYQLLNGGGAMVRSGGPLLVGSKKMDTQDLIGKKIAIPGRHTTANLLLSIFYPGIYDKVEMLFSEIEAAVQSGYCDAGLLIHEGRFTYEKKGLIKLADLGEDWQKQIHLPLPLGCIAISRNFSQPEKREIDKLIRDSVIFANNYPGKSAAYTKLHAQEMDPEIINKHIQLYVNQFSIESGAEGRSALEFLFRKAIETGFAGSLTHPVFID